MATTIVATSEVTSSAPAAVIPTVVEGTNLRPVVEIPHERRPEGIVRGYAGSTLKIDLTNRAAIVKPVTEEMKQLFTGGKGFDLKLLWDSVPARCAWDDPLNEIVLASGPLGGAPNYPGAGKSIVVGISPLTGHIVDSNVGGFFGPYLKWSGFDALEIQGKAAVPLVVLIDGETNKVVFYEAHDLPEDSYILSECLTNFFGGETGQRAISVVTAGPGAKRSLWGCVNISWYDTPRKCCRRKQAGRGGLGTVFATKNVLAVCVKSPRMPNQAETVADIETLREVGRMHSTEIATLDRKQNEMASVGMTYDTE
ncbi:aldehyde:ferredoxin oxidoreductase [Pelomyxa schiedti]|nr:aldehyde:ferredoxin oxidoreductase [Pelomyxa schiedti]